MKRRVSEFVSDVYICDADEEFLDFFRVFFVDGAEKRIQSVRGGGGDRRRGRGCAHHRCKQPEKTWREKVKVKVTGYVWTTPPKNLNRKVVRQRSP